jgi:integrase
VAKPVKHYDKWRIRPIGADGKRRSLVFDTFAEADAALKLIEAEAVRARLGLPALFAAPAAPASVGVPDAAKKTTAETGATNGTNTTVPEKTFADLANFWLNNKAPGKRSRKDDKSMIRCHLLPAFGPLRLSEPEKITERVIEHSAQHKGNEKTLSNRLTLLETMFRLAVDLEWCPRLPKIPKPKITICDANFRWLKTEAEIERVLHAAREEGEQVYVLYATAVWTGLRKGELAALTWADIDLERRLISVERSHDGPTKSGRTRHVLIVDRLLPVLRAWRQRCPGDLVFPNERGTKHNKSARIFEETLHRVLKRAGFPHKRERGKVKPFITFHDFRHTFASQWVLAGGPMYKLQKLLGHASSEMTQRYAHLAPTAYDGDRGVFGPAIAPATSDAPSPANDNAVAV